MCYPQVSFVSHGELGNVIRPQGVDNIFSKLKYDDCRAHPSSVVERFDSSDVSAASQFLAWTVVRFFSEQESSQHRKVTTSLGWAITMCSGPPAILDCKKRSNSRLAESRRRVDGFPTTAFVNWANRCSMAYSSMHSRAASLSFEP